MRTPAGYWAGDARGACQRLWGSVMSETPDLEEKLRRLVVYFYEHLNREDALKAVGLGD
jgi:hypothetical protein